MSDVEIARKFGYNKIDHEEHLQKFIHTLRFWFEQNDKKPSKDIGYDITDFVLNVAQIEMLMEQFKDQAKYLTTPDRRDL